MEKITSLTLASAALGILTAALHPICAFIMVFVIFVPKFVPIIGSHDWKKLATFTVTTFLFGIIDGFCGVQIILFVYNGFEGATPLIQIYLIIATIYHYFEFQLINNFHHSSLEWKSFLIYHSRPYFLANLFMYTEHIITKYILQFNYKDSHPFIIPGLILCLAGETLRVCAFFTCKSNFTHIVRFRKVQGHQLVTNGVYSFFRHPSYTGYFYFAIGAQIMIGNIACTIAYIYVLTKFFRDRINDQEEALAKFFPEYPEYQQRTKILIPFVKGAILQSPQASNMKFQSEIAQTQQQIE